MRNTFRWTLIAAIATYLLIFTGGLVRVSGAGLGCPDWPQCFGRWIPPTNVSQLPPDMDPAKFNFTLAWIEYLNRLFGVFTGLIILVAAILAVKHFSKTIRIILPSVLAALLVAYTGWQGGKVVESELESTLVSVHALFAILIAALLIYAAQQIHYVLNPAAESGRSYPRRSSLWLGILLIAAIVQAALGTNMRSTIEAFAQANPMAEGLAWLKYSRALNHLHLLLGVLIVLKGLSWAVRLLRRSENPSALLWQSAWGMSFLLIAQGLLGVLVFLGPTPLLQVLHLWCAALIIGIFLLSYGAVKRASMSTITLAGGNL
jgi:cytochrome c oxidase assembly protein subunit 15